MKFSIKDYDAKDIIRFIREYTGLTQKQFAQKINKSYDWVQSTELGRLNYKFEDLIAICNLFNLNITIEAVKEKEKIFQDAWNIFLFCNSLSSFGFMISARSI